MTKAVKVALHRVNSTSATHAGYDAATKTLAVQFKGSKAPYHYHGVEPSTYKDLLASHSFGQFLQANVIGKYPHTKPQEVYDAAPLG